MTFDAHHPKYFHTLCVGAHVTKAARSIAVFSLVSAVLRTFFFLATQYKDWDRYITFMFVLDFCCVFALLAGVYKEKGWMVIPYLLDQVLSIVLMIFVTIAIITEMPDLKDEGMEYTEELKITAAFMGVITIAFMFYMSKIVLNFFFYLSARDIHERTNGLSVSYQAPSAPFDHQYSTVQYQSGANECPSKNRDVPNLEAGQLEPPPPYVKY